MSEAMFQHVRVIGKKFEGASVVLDNMWFENCSFENCDVFYSGGPTETHSCRSNEMFRNPTGPRVTAHTLPKGFIRPPSTRPQHLLECAQMLAQEGRRFKGVEAKPTSGLMVRLA